MPGLVQIKVAEKNNRSQCITSQDKGLARDRPWEVAGLCLSAFKADEKLQVEAGGFGLPAGKVQLWAAEDQVSPTDSAGGEVPACPGLCPGVSSLTTALLS